MMIIALLIYLITNLESFAAYEFGDRIPTSKNFDKSYERIRKSQSPTFHASSNDVPERAAEEVVLDGGLFELLDGGKNLSDALDLSENKESVVHFYPINEFIDIASDATTSFNKNGDLEISAPFEGFQNEKDGEGDDDMISASSDIVRQTVEHKDKDQWKSKEIKKENLENFEKKKIVTSYVNFGPKLSALKSPESLTRKASAKPKYTFRRINDNKDTPGRTYGESGVSEDTNKPTEERENVEESSYDVGNQSVTKNNKPTKIIRDKVKYVEVKRVKGKTNDDIKIPSYNDALLLSASNNDDVPFAVTTEPIATTFASFHYFTKNNKNNSSQSPDIRLTVKKTDKNLPNKGITNIRISEKTRNTFYLLNGSQSAQLPDDSIEKKIILNPSKTSNSNSEFDFILKNHQPFALSPPSANFSKHSQSPLQYFSAPPPQQSELESNLAIDDDEENSKVYKDILASTKSIIQKAKLQFHKQETIPVPHKYLQPPKVIQVGESAFENFNNQPNFPNFGSSSTITKTLITSPIKTIFHSSNNNLPKFTTTPSNGNLYREDLTGSDSTSERIWPLWRQQIEHDEEPVGEATISEVSYSLPESNVPDDPEDNHGQFRDSKKKFQQNSTRPTAVAFATSELKGPTKSTEFLYDRPNNFHTSFEDYLETHGIFGSKFNKGISQKVQNNNKVELRKNYNKPDFSDHRAELQKSQGNYHKAESELRNLVPIPTFKTTDQSNQGESKGYYNNLIAENTSLNNDKKNYHNLKEKQLPLNSKNSLNSFTVDSKQLLKSSDSLSLSNNVNQILSSANPEESVKQAQEPKEITPPQKSEVTSQNQQQLTYPIGSHINHSSKFKVNPPVINTILKRPQSFRPKPLNRPHYPQPRHPLNSILRSQSRGKEKRPQFHPRLALSKYLQPPPPISYEEENEIDNSVASYTQTAQLNIQPANLTAYYKSYQQIPVQSLTHKPIGINSNQEPLFINYNHLTKVTNSNEFPLQTSSNQENHYYFPSPYQLEYQIPLKHNSLQYQPDFKIKDLLPEGKLRAPDVDNSIAHSIKFQDNQPLTSVISNYSPSIASHVRGNTPSYQNELKFTSPSLPTPGSPLRPPFYPTKAPPHQQLHKMPTKRHRPKLFLGFNPLSLSSSNIHPIRYRPPRKYPPMFGRATHFSESNEQVYHPVKDKQSSHFKVIMESEENITDGLAGKSNDNIQTYQQFEKKHPHNIQNTVKPLNVLDYLVASESVSLPIKVQSSSLNNTKDLYSNQNTSQPLPKEIIKKRNERVPESHLSMLRSLKYGIHGEPLDVWIPIKSTEEK